MTILTSCSIIRFWQSSGESLKTSIRTRHGWISYSKSTALWEELRPMVTSYAEWAESADAVMELYDLIIDPVASRVVKKYLTSTV